MSSPNDDEAPLLEVGLVRDSLFGLFSLGTKKFFALVNFSAAPVTEDDELVNAKPEPKYPPQGLKGLLFWGVGDLVKHGSKEQITMDDLWRLERDIESTNIWDAFITVWHASPGSITRTILKVYRWSLLIQLIRHFIMAILQFTAVVMIPSLIAWLEDPEEPEYLGPLYIGIIITTILCQRLLVSQGNAHAFKLMCQIQSNMMLAIYDKSLMLAPNKDQDTGKLMSLMGGDTNTIAWTLPTLIEAPISFLRVIAIVGLMWGQIGPYCLISVGILMTMVPITAKLGGLIHAQIKVQRDATDARVKLINELVAGIRLVRFYAWEPFFNERISTSRETELSTISRMLTLQALMQFGLMVTPVLVTGVTFMVFGLTQELTLSKALTTLALINTLRNDFMQLPPVVTGWSQWKTSAKRIEELLEQPELTCRDQADLLKPAKIRIDNATFRWGDENDTDSNCFTLSDINLNIPNPSLTIVLGAVATGKSTLASAILGEIPKVSGGDCTLHGTVAYAPQQPWIVNATVRDNILLGKPYDEEWFKHVVSICALGPDLESFPAGDMTEIGERGVNASGGQRARISLARAVYSKADVYILDDPLSAVDSRIAAHIFDRVIRQELKSKIVVMISNQLQYAPDANLVLVMDKGAIRSSGRFEDIMEKDTIFAELMRDNGVQKSESGSSISSNSLQPSDEGGKADKESMKGQGKSGALVKTEEGAKGRVSFGVYAYYATAAGLGVVCCLFLFRAIVAVMNAASVYWLSFWTTDSVTSGKPVGYYVGIYSGLNGTEAVFMLLFLYTMTRFLYRSGKFLHEKALAGIIRAPVSFFDRTPMGRAIARFSVDFTTIDIQLGPILILMFVSGFNLASTLFSMSLGAPWMLIVAIPSTIFCFIFQRYYQLASIQVKRLESASKAPIYSHFGETIAGASSVRAFAISDQFKRGMDKRVDENNICVMGNRYTTSWFNLRLSMVVMLIQATAYITTVAMRLNGSLNVGLAALTISLTPQITAGYIQVTNAVTQLEARMNSIERVREYAFLEQEPPEIIPGHRPSESWPYEGKVEFVDFCLRYRSVNDLALKNVSFSVKSHERVGIVGRSGAGKSSLMLALFRMVEGLSGKIVIDGVDIATIGLRDLRSKLSIIPQEPLLFAGTLRYNLDPFERFPDDELWDVLETVSLKDYVSTLPGKLEAQVEENGRNYSVGQRQLICMARSLLTRARILLLDEASASLDPVSDSLIQRTIRNSFTASTILVIAHKIQTVVDLDRILVMSDGRVVEFDTPQALLSDPNSTFSAMVDATGESLSRHIRGVVFQAASKRCEAQLISGL